MKRKQIMALLLATLMAVQATGCGGTDQGADQENSLVQESPQGNEITDVENVSQGNTETSETDQVKIFPEKEETNKSETSQEIAGESSKKSTTWIVGTYEAEEAQLKGNVKVSESAGVGYVSGFEKDDDSCSFAVDVDADGFYDFNFVSASEGGYKENYVSVDGDSLGTVSVESAEFTDSVVSRVYLTQGTHEVAVSKYWGWIKLDKLIVQTSEPIDERIYQVSAELVNPNATDEAKQPSSSCITRQIARKMVRFRNISMSSTRCIPTSQWSMRELQTMLRQHC